MTLYHQRRISHLLVLLFAEHSSLPLARKPHENRVGFLTVKSVNLPQCLNTLSRHLSGSVGQGSDFGSGRDPTLRGLGLKILPKVGPSIPSGPNGTARVFLATASISFGPRPCWFLRWVQGGSTGGFQPVSLWSQMGVGSFLAPSLPRGLSPERQFLLCDARRKIPFHEAAWSAASGR